MVQIVYVFTGCGTGKYSDQLRLSVLSALRHMPSALVSVLSDPVSASALRGGWPDSVLREVTIIEASVPEEMSALDVSRYLKTSARNLVDGDYLYLDTDTIVCRDLADLLPGKQSELAFAFERNSHNGVVGRADVSLIAKTMARSCLSHDTGLPYFNSGAYWAKDSVAVREFFRDWSAAWSSSVKRGVGADQPALNSVNSLHGGFITPLDPRLNLQVSGDTDAFAHLGDPGVLHYFNGVSGSLSVTRREVLRSVVSDPVAVAHVLSDPLSTFCGGVYLSRGAVDHEIYMSTAFRMLQRMRRRMPRLFLGMNHLLSGLDALIRKVKGESIVRRSGE